MQKISLSGEIGGPSIHRYWRLGRGERKMNESKSNEYSVTAHVQNMRPNVMRTLNVVLLVETVTRLSVRCCLIVWGVSTIGKKHHARTPPPVFRAA